MKTQSNVQPTLWILPLLLLTSLSAYAEDGQIMIAQTPDTTFPIYIRESGSYVLTTNLVSTGQPAIIIDAHNVTLDLNGHSIIGNRLIPLEGIYAYRRNNITIMNGTVRDFGSHGIHFVPPEGGHFHRIQDINLYNNGGSGISAHGPVSVTNCTAINNSGSGIFATKGTITNSIAAGNGGSGFEASDASIINSSANSNVGPGFSGGQLTISNSTSNRNAVGFSIYDSTLANCTSAYNNSHGINATNSSISNCVALENKGDGVHVGSGDYRSATRIEGVNVESNWGYGIYLQGYHNYAIKNTAVNNLGNFFAVAPDKNYMPTSLTGPDAANANIGW